MPRELRDAQPANDWMCDCGPLEAEKPQADSQDEMEISVLQPQGSESVHNPHEFRSRFFPNLQIRAHFLTLWLWPYDTAWEEKQGDGS